jgi:hypothetical protein
MNLYSKQVPELSPTNITQNVTGPLIKGMRYPNESIAEASSYEGKLNPLMFLVLGISASIVSATAASLMIARKSRKSGKL